MSEAALKARLRKKIIERGVFQEPGYTPYSTGKPDHYYEGFKGALWIEYKWRPRAAPCQVDLTKNMEPRQRAWINRARANGVRAWVAIGIGKGMMVVNIDSAPADMATIFITEKDFVQLVFETVGESL